MAKKKAHRKAVKAIQKAVRKAVHKGVTEKTVEDTVEKTIEKVANDKKPPVKKTPVSQETGVKKQSIPVKKRSAPKS